VTPTDWGGTEFLGALRQASAQLRAQVDEVNALNVFPVPDGDTGSNMLSTLQAALQEADTTAADDTSLAAIAGAASMGALMGARGNSGVILSQLFRGVAETLRDKDSLGGKELAEALERGSEAAFSAVAKPVEGTILSVARDVSKVAVRTARRDASLSAVLSASVDEARAAVERTPSQLPILRHAGVVDAGGRGLELILAGTLAYLRGEAPAVHGAVPVDAHFPDFAALEEDGYGYETVYVITPQNGLALDAVAIRNQLERLGESVLVAGDHRAVKIHVHNERPDEVIAYGLSQGMLSRITVENLDRQARDVRQAHTPAAAATPAAVVTAAPATAEPLTYRVLHGPAVIAVAPGAGLAHVFEALGAHAVVRSDDGANASAGELAAAIRGTACQQVIVLPNNPNVRLAARQGGELCPGQEVSVVPTRNPAEGVAAMLALDESLDLEQNVARMTDRMHATATLQVAQAVRNARMGRRRVRKGQFIVLGGDQKLLVAGDDRHAAVIDGLNRAGGDFELVTIYHGDGSDRGDAQALADAIRARFEAAEVEIVDGGQPHYCYLISAE
jgi:uncharacterized protein